MDTLERRCRARHEASLAVAIGSLGAIALLEYGPSWFGDSDERNLSRWAEEHVAPVDSVACPAHDHGKVGATYRCTVTFASGRVATLHAFERAHETDYFWDPPIYAADKLAAVLRPLLKGDWRDAAVDCGTGILDLPPGGIRCTASKFGHSEHVTFTLDGDNPVVREAP